MFESTIVKASRRNHIVHLVENILELLLRCFRTSVDTISFLQDSAKAINFSLIHVIDLLWNSAAQPFWEVMLNDLKDKEIEEDL